MCELKRYAPRVLALLTAMAVVACAEAPDVPETAEPVDDPLIIEDDSGAVTELVPVSEELVNGLDDDVRVHLDLRVENIIYVLEHLGDPLPEIALTCPNGVRWALGDWLDANGFKLAEAGQVTTLSSGPDVGGLVQTMDQVVARMKDVYGCPDCEYDCVNKHGSENICWTDCPCSFDISSWGQPTHDESSAEWPWWLEPYDTPMPPPPGPDPAPEQGTPPGSSPDGADYGSEMPPPPMPGGGSGAGGTPAPSGDSGGSGGSSDSSGGSGGHSSGGGWDW